MPTIYGSKYSSPTPNVSRNPANPENGSSRPMTPPDSKVPSKVRGASETLNRFEPATSQVPTRNRTPRIRD